MKSQKINIALIGAGRMGKRWCMAILKVKTVSLKFIVDTDLEKASIIAQQFPRVKISTNWRDPIKNPQVNAILVVVPHKYLARISQAALKNKKHVLSEKPGGLKSSEIKNTISLASQNKVQYMVGFNHRYHEAFLKAKSLVEKGTIGDILFIRSRYGFEGRAGYEKEWRMSRELSGGGELIDQGVHMIDMIRWFMGDITESKGFACSIYWKSNVDDNAFVLLRSKKNQFASIHVSLTQWKPLHNFEIYGTKGYLSIEGLGRRYGGTEKLIIGLKPSEFGKVNKEKVIVCNPEADNSLIRELHEFVAAIKENRTPQPSGQDAYKTLKIVESIYKGQ